MGAKTLAALEGAWRGVPERRSAARRSSTRAPIERVDGVSLLEFGTPEAMWHLTVERFSGDRHDGRARQQAAQGRRSRSQGEHLETRSAVESGSAVRCCARQRRANSFSRRRRYWCSIAATSRSIVSRSAIASSGNGDSSGTSTVFRYAPQVRHNSSAAILALSSGAAVTNGSPLSLAVHARVGRQLPRRGAERTAQRCGGRRRLPRAPATIRTPGSSRGSTPPARRPAPVVGAKSDCCSACANGLTASSATSQTQVRREPAVHGAGPDRAADRAPATRSAATPASMPPPSMAAPDVRGGFAGAAVGQRVAQLQQRRLERSDRQRNRLAGKRRARPWPSLAARYLRRKRQPGQAGRRRSSRAQVDDEPNQPLLEGERPVPGRAGLREWRSSAARRYRRARPGRPCRREQARTAWQLL